jgi:hypothetical protein
LGERLPAKYSPRGQRALDKFEVLIADRTHMSFGAGTLPPGVSALLTADRPATRLATRLAFLVAGFGVACWAPLVPFAKERLQVDDGVLGLLLLCLGVGSVAAML